METRQPQQPGDTLPGADHPAVPEFDPDARRTVGAATLLVHCRDMARDLLVRPTPSGGETRAPRVLATAGDSKQATERCHRVRCLLRLDEREHRERIASRSLAKQAAARSRAPGAGCALRGAGDGVPRVHSGLRRHDHRRRVRRAAPSGGAFGRRRQGLWQCGSASGHRCQRGGRPRR